jgi:hypothetical protein
VDEPSPQIIIGSKIGRRPLIGRGRIGKDCYIFIGQRQEVHFGRWKVLEGANNSWAFLSHGCIRIEMYVT